MVYKPNKANVETLLIGGGRRLEWTGKGDSQNTSTVIRVPNFYRKFGHVQTEV
jgi:hypothetical protein